MFKKIKLHYVIDAQSTQVLLVSLLTVVLSFLMQGYKGFNFGDEGFLWYGAQRVLLGEVPIRDFMAYDPGRYYWSAAFMSLFGDSGIMSLRFAVAIFQVMGLFVGLLLITQAIKKYNILYLLLSAFTLLMWMLPRHKLFDISLSIILVGVLAYLVQNPTTRRYFIVGLCVGLVAFFGRNHGVYGVVASIGVMLWLSINQNSGPVLIKGFVFWAGGVAIGFSPMIVMILLVPGFATAFFESVLFLFEVKATNIPLAIPWPWLVDFSSVPFGQAVRKVLVGIFFIATIAFGVLSIIWLVWNRIHEKATSPVFVAAAFLALPYAHYAYSRADVSHLAQGVFPLLIGCLALLSNQSAKLKWSLSLMLCAASFWVLHVYHPAWQCRASKKCVSLQISGDNLEVRPNTAKFTGLLRDLNSQYAPNGENFMAAPFWPGAYSLLGRESPMWEVFALWPRSDEFQINEVNRIKAANPRFIILSNYALDGRDVLRFRNTHPLVYQYIKTHFRQRLDPPDFPYEVYISKSGK